MPDCHKIENKNMDVNINGDTEMEGAAIGENNKIISKVHAQGHVVLADNSQVHIGNNYFYSEKIKTPKTHIIRLRSKPIMVSKEEYNDVFKLNRHCEPQDSIYIQNNFRGMKYIVVDYATELIWQKASSDEMEYPETQRYIGKLNLERFAGFYDWRLPTIPELMSLIEPKPQLNCLCLSPYFKTHETELCWSADIRPERSGVCHSNWYVCFNDGSVFWSTPGHKRRIRAVRSGIYEIETRSDNNRHGG